MFSVAGPYRPKGGPRKRYIYCPTPTARRVEGGKSVVRRTKLILKIFARRGKLVGEIARRVQPSLDHRLPEYLENSDGSFTRRVKQVIVPQASTRRVLAKQFATRRVVFATKYCQTRVRRILSQNTFIRRIEGQLHFRHNTRRVASKSSLARRVRVIPHLQLSTKKILVGDKSVRRTVVIAYPVGGSVRQQTFTSSSRRLNIPATTKHPFSGGKWIVVWGTVRAANKSGKEVVAAGDFARASGFRRKPTASVVVLGEYYILSPHLRETQLRVPLIGWFGSHKMLPHSTDTRNLLPLPLKVTKGPAPGISSGRSRARNEQRKRSTDIFNQMVGAINILSMGEVASFPEKQFEGEPRLGCQRVATRLLERLGELASRRDYYTFSVTGGLNRAGQDFLEEQCYLKLDNQTRRVWLDPDKVALPPEGITGRVDFTKYLPPEQRSRYQTPQGIIREPNELQNVRFHQPFIGASGACYQKLIERLSENKMVRLSRFKPKVVNGIFGVSKLEGSQRLIIDARNANQVFVEPPEVELPNPGMLAELHLDEGGRLFIAKSDLDNFYHRLKLPDWMTTYFGLPSIWVDQQEYWPEVCSLPMGWSHSVYVGQQVHMAVIRMSGIPLEKSILAEPIYYDIGDFRFGAYIDDYFSLGESEELASQHLGQVLKVTERENLPAKPSKVTLPSPPAELVTVLGIDIYADGQLRPNPEKMRNLIADTLAFCKFRKWNKRHLESILGKWAWFLLLRRPLFSVLDKVYKAKDDNRDLFRPQASARKELKMLVAMAPLLRTDMTRQMADFVICTDACNYGGAVVYTRLDKGESFQLLHSSFDDKTNWVKRQNWHVAIKHRWIKRQHIHVLEGEAIVLAVRWMVRKATNHRRRVILFTDSQTVLGALKKGRSSKPALNGVCRRVAAYLMASDIKLELFYIASANNPADGPSRYL